MADELLSCPFCGGEARPDAQTHMGRNYVGIICLGCGLWQDTRSPDIIGAIAAWNRRTPPTPATDECTCFGDSGMQASTFCRSDDVRCCDLCGKPVASTPPTPITEEPWEGPLTDKENAMLEAAWQKHKDAAPPTPATEEREAVAHAIELCATPYISEALADAALSALAPYRAAEIDRLHAIGEQRRATLKTLESDNG